MKKSVRIDVDKRSIFRVGEVYSVSGREISIKVDVNKNSSHLMYCGQLIKNVSVGGYLKILKGFDVLVVKVESECLKENSNSSQKVHTLGEENFRILIAKLIGYFDGTVYKKGVKELPLIGNECILLDNESFSTIHKFAKEDEDCIEIGCLMADQNVPISISVDKLFASHIGIFGNTGSGKSHTLASLYQTLFDKYGKNKRFNENAKFILFDFNGEYSGKEVITSSKQVYNLSTLKGDGDDKIPLHKIDLLRPELPIRNGDHIIGVLIQERHIDEKVFTSQRLQSAQQSYEAISGGLARLMPENNWLTECIDEALLIVNDAGIIAFRNSLAKELYQKLGYIDDVLGQPYDNVFLVNTDPACEGSHMEVEVGRYVLDVKYIPLGAPNMAFVLVIRDLTWRREQEKALVLKSVAVKEMHHRVKNNLQTIASLLRLQTRRSDSPETRQVLEESMNRIIAIASTHELLAQRGMDEVQLSDVVRNIKSNVLRSCAGPHFKVAVSLEGGDFTVDSEVGTSVALVVNELLQNAMKYAFPPDSEGLVRIIMARGDLYSRIQVIDNGRGFNVQDASKPKLGLSIVQTLVEDKLFGNLDIESGPQGTQVTFDFRTQLTNPDDVA